MRIGMDLDGVLCEISIGLLRSLDAVKDKTIRESANEWYYRERKPQLNANLFLHRGDTLTIITSRDNGLKKITEDWVNRYYPNAKLIILDYKSPLGLGNERELKEWLEGQAKAKAKTLDKEVDVYFEDSPSVVTSLRKHCKKCMIIHYGGRW